MSLQWRIWGAFILVVILTVLLSVAVANWAASQQLEELRAELSDERAYELAYYLSQEYTQADGWETLESALFDRYLYDPAKLKDLYGELEASDVVLDEAFFLEEEPMHVVVVGEDGQVLLDSYDEWSVGDFPDEVTGNEAAIVDLRSRQAVGAVFVDIEREMLSAEFDDFLADILYTTTIGGLLTGILVLLLGVWFANRITAPVTALTQATQSLAATGNTTLLPVTSSDELGQMSAAFNQLTAALQTQRDLRKRLIDDVSHELNTPLSVIQLEANGLRDGMQSPEEAAENIIQEITLLYNLVHDLNWLGETDAGQERLNLEPCDLAQLLATEVERWQTQAQTQQIDLSVLPLPSLPGLYLDKLRMAQILGNLLGNALQHTDAGGSVAVSAQLRPIPNQPGEWVVLTVKDTGHGIAPDDLPHIFERFYRSDPARIRDGGRGLGLAITRQLVHLHGGHIWAESILGQGSQFYLALAPSDS